MCTSQSAITLWGSGTGSGRCVTSALPPLSCIPPVVMQKTSQGPNWMENADNADETEIT